MLSKNQVVGTMLRYAQDAGRDARGGAMKNHIPNIESARMAV
jgi:hypothetical protein